MVRRLGSFALLALGILAMLSASGCAGPCCGVRWHDGNHGCRQCSSQQCAGAQAPGNPQIAAEECTPENCPKCKLLGHHCPWHAKPEESWIPGSSLFQGGIEPPRPKFHPVPTRNVFAPRPDTPPAVLPQVQPEELYPQMSGMELR